MKFNIGCLIVIVLLVFRLPTRTTAAPLYHLTDLGDLPGGNDGSEAFSLNSLGQVVGISSTTALVNVATPSHGFLWNSTTGLQDLGALSGVSTEAVGINDNGQVSGWYTTVDTAGKTNGEHAVVWSSPGQAQELGQLPGDTSSRASAINKNGQVVGVSEVDAHGGTQRPYIWSSATGMQYLGAITGGTGTGHADAINDSGVVTGTAGGATAAYAFRWTSSGGMESLGAIFPQTGSQGFGVNNLGDIVGSTAVSSNTHHAFLWRVGTGMQDLGELPGGSHESSAIGINSNDDVVGYSPIGPFPKPDHAFIWTMTGGMKDLNNLLDSSGAGWTISIAKSINDAGQIAADAISPSGTHHGILLTPVPEPSATILITLGFFAIRTRCRRSPS